MSADMSAPVVFIDDDDASLYAALASLPGSCGFQAVACATGAEFLARMPPDCPCCVLLDVRVKDVSGLDSQAELGRRRILLPIAFMTGHGDIPMTVRAIKAGALDCEIMGLAAGGLMNKQTAGQIGQTDAALPLRGRRSRGQIPSSLRSPAAALGPFRLILDTG